MDLNTKRLTEAELISTLRDCLEEAARRFSQPTEKVKITLNPYHNELEMEIAAVIEMAVNTNPKANLDGIAASVSLKFDPSRPEPCDASDDEDVSGKLLVRVAIYPEGADFWPCPAAAFHIDLWKALCDDLDDCLVGAKGDFHFYPHEWFGQWEPIANELDAIAKHIRSFEP